MNKDRVIYISLGFAELEQQLYSRQDGVVFVGKDERDHYLFRTTMNRGKTAFPGLNSKSGHKSIYRSNIVAKPLDSEWNWSARYIITNTALKDGLDGKYNEFIGANENTKIIITGHGDVEVNCIYAHYGNDSWCYNHYLSQDKKDINYLDKKDFLRNRIISFSDLAKLISKNLETYSPAYTSSINRPLHISLSSCLMAFTSGYDPKKSGAAKFLAELKKNGIFAEIRARATSAITPREEDTQVPMGLGTGKVPGLINRDKNSPDATIKARAKKFGLISNTPIKSHKIRSFNFTYKWISNTEMTVTDSSDSRSFSQIQKDQVITNLYYIAYRTNIEEKRGEILGNVALIRMMEFPEIIRHLNRWVNDRGAQIHKTGFLYYGTANSVKVIKGMIDELQRDVAVSPYLEENKNLSTAFLFMKQKVAILENLYYLAYTTEVVEKCDEILNRAGQIQLMEDGLYVSSLLEDWLDDKKSAIYKNSHHLSFMETRSVKAIKKMLSELSRKSAITRV